MQGLLPFNDFRERLAKPNAVVHCAQIKLSAPRGTFEVITGAGKIVFREDGDIEFETQATLSKEQLAELNSKHLGNFFSLQNLVLAARAYDGLELWAPVLDARIAHQSMDNSSFIQVRGTLRVVQADFSVPAGTATAAVIYTNAPDVPLTVWNKMEVIYEGNSEVLKREAVGHHIKTMGTTVKVKAKPAARELELRAEVGLGAYQHPYLEGLLIEPFQVLNGTNQVPRYVIREFGDGRAFVCIFPQEKHPSSLGGASSVFQLKDAERYWDFYAKYLSFIADGFDLPSGVGPNKLTLFHEQINRAVHGGSHWLVSLALSSAIEGLLMAHPAGQKVPSTVTAEEHQVALDFVGSLKNGQLKVKLDQALKGILSDQKPSGSSVLKALVTAGTIEAKHKKAWEKFRHHVSHGNLLKHDGPDERLPMFPALYELFQLLTANAIGFTDLDFKKSSVWREAVSSYPPLAWFIA